MSCLHGTTIWKRTGAAFSNGESGYVAEKSSSQGPANMRDVLSDVCFQLKITRDRTIEVDHQAWRRNTKQKAR